MPAPILVLIRRVGEFYTKTSRSYSYFGNQRYLQRSLEHTESVSRTFFLEKLHAIADETFSRAAMHTVLINLNARDVCDFLRASSLYIDKLDWVALRADIVMDGQVNKDYDLKKLPFSVPADTDT